ncbi:hypothetical protein VOLCADRAFT_104808 [Volvox carteri f. nagariensis]|uniref:S1 motif domain-containing protein n=1 Tax=Volvox carteri f. nagariensis TaxID=3068 RepID=D8TW86_VOLCA|nr:uncharacterized protein VOLCADRAFT_104808 [Volvox carteri f. nagariensis]EFJ48430.1 hypothetical protein VOLCADRAFT_104808 [Volvox carteri f. nagariensis]|eukprot:XP_002950684.1 hypothetical protein VOLCADRAFT_104808 [Volvox carteri f. nagariensis]
MRASWGATAESTVLTSRTRSMTKLVGCFWSRRTAPRVLAAQASKRSPEAPLPQLTRPKPASAAQQAQAQPPASPAVITDAYKRASDAKARCETVDVKVVSQNEGGVIVQYGPVRGFIPYNQMDPARLRACANGDLSTLTGQQLKARVVTADASRKELVLSERQVAAAEALRRIEPGAVLTCVVTAVEDYGAFVQVKGMPEVVGLVHKSEVSWDRIMTVDQVVSIGQEVVAKVLSVDANNVRLTLSMKQMSTDPLRLSLDGLAWEVAAPGAAYGDVRVQGLIEALSTSVGVDSVAPTRVAQELEVYLVRSDREADGQYTAVARMGVSATELELRAAELSREQVKQLLQRVASRIAAQ